MLEKTSGTYVYNQNRQLWAEALLNDSFVLENFYRNTGLVCKAAVIESYFPVLLERGTQIMVVNYCASSHFMPVLQGVKIQT